MANSAHVASAESAAAVSLSPTVSQVRLPSHAANKALARLDNTDAWLEVAQQLGLSSQELNVALHILAGEKLTTISWELNLALGTVKTYCQRIYHKLCVSDHCTLAVVMLSHYFDSCHSAVPASATKNCR